MAQGYRFSALLLFVRLPLRTVLHTFDFQGRSTRTETLFWLLIAQFLAGLPRTAASPLSAASYDVAENTLVLLLFAPFVALAARRLNDQERTRWWLLLLPLGLVDEAAGLFPSMLGPPGWVFAMTNLFAFLGLFAVLFLETGTPGPNKFGENPRTALAYS